MTRVQSYGPHGSHPNAAPSNGNTAGDQGPLLQASLSVAGTERVMFLSRSGRKDGMSQPQDAKSKAGTSGGSTCRTHGLICLQPPAVQFSFMPVTGRFENFTVFPFSTTPAVQPNSLSRHHRLCCQFISLCRPRHTRPPIPPDIPNSPVGRAPRSLTRFFRARQRHDGIRLLTHLISLNSSKPCLP